jgi:hypothetical protein
MAAERRLVTDVRIKRGMPLSLNVVFANADGSAFDLTTVVLGGTVRDARDNLVQVLQPQASTVAGAASVYVPSTAAWPLGLLRGDIVVTDPDGSASISEAFGIRVERPVTELSPPGATYDPVGDAGAPPPAPSPFAPVG